MKKEKTFVKKIINWHKEQNFSFPWRKTNNPFHIMIAEILLKKTTRDQVNQIYEKIIKKYSTPQKLARARISSLEKMLEKLGMQKKRSRLLKELAKYIVNVHKGEMPRGEDELRNLPGIGKYTSNAVLCLAYNKPLPLVDTNVIRIMERIFSLKSNRARAREDPAIWAFVGKFIIKNKARDLNLAMIDFANQICSAKNPSCDICPLIKICSYQNKNLRNSNN